MTDQPCTSAAQPPAEKPPCPVGPNGDHKWVDDYGVGEAECLWCMARAEIASW